MSQTSAIGSHANGQELSLSENIVGGGIRGTAFRFLIHVYNLLLFVAILAALLTVPEVDEPGEMVMMSTTEVLLTVVFAFAIVGNIAAVLSEGLNGGWSTSVTLIRGCTRGTLWRARSL